LDIIKDRLYVEKANGRLRRSAQTACWHLLDTLTRLIAPIFSFTAEQVSDLYQKDKKESIHLQHFSILKSLWGGLCEKPSGVLPDLKVYVGSYCETKDALDLFKLVTEKERIWNVLKDIRSVVLKAIEEQREKQIMKHSLEASVTVYFDLEDERLAILNDFYEMLEKANQDIDDFFREFLIVSQFTIAESDIGLAYSGMEGLSLKVKKAEGDKCPRCWQWDITDHEHALCNRCQKILG